MTSLDLSPLARALAQLEKSLGYYHSTLARNDPELAQQFRTAAIKGFEFTYELSWKMLKRHMELTLPDPESVNHMTFPELIRTGCELGLLRSDWETWKGFRQTRGTSSHAYGEEMADRVFAAIPGFLVDARDLLERLQAGSVQP